MQSRSLWPLLSGQAGLDRHREDVYCEYYNALTSHRDPTAQATMVRDDRFKLVVMHGLDTGELYDLEADPRESSNLWAVPDAQGIKLAMFQRLCDRMAWTVDPLPERESPW